MLTQIDDLRVKIRSLTADISHAADIEPLDPMPDEIGSFARQRGQRVDREYLRCQLHADVVAS
ncbi:hypothetical protein CFB89_09610 [Burkholderia sp. AU16741]|uniref:hypothetical protein n=1 Tax=Burkholderia sp. AU16741 TaxID=2015347 RepID=UPI000B79C5EC|nr:hypothetical protein [Burkholderia sp. AU16741]OXI34953.1 hypothetical protein CFB89_09610 [Burkholderia sp. AU16741]